MFSTFASKDFGHTIQFFWVFEAYFVSYAQMGHDFTGTKDMCRPPPHSLNRGWMRPCPIFKQMLCFGPHSLTNKSRFLGKDKFVKEIVLLPIFTMQNTLALW